MNSDETVKKLVDILNDDKDYGDCIECGTPLWEDDTDGMCEDCREELE